MKKNVLSGAIFLALSAAFGQSQADSIAESDSVDDLENQRPADVILVTATRRAEDVQEVPISISVFDEQIIQDTGIRDMQELSFYAPGLSINQTTRPVGNRIAIRGVGSSGSTALEPSVGVYVDGVYIPRPGSIVGRLQDLEAVEVLRGPQGTLFGRNSSMGALNIRTIAARGDDTVEVRAGLGSFSLREGGITVDRSLAPEVAGRIAFKFSENEGWATSDFDGTEVGEWKDYGFRGSLVFPIGQVQGTLRADWNRIENNGHPNTVVAASVLPQYLNVIRFALDPNLTIDKLQTGFTGPIPNVTNEFSRRLNQAHLDENEDEQWGLSLDLQWGMATHDFRSITAFRDWDSGGPESVIRFPADLLPRVTDYSARTFSQELQVLSDLPGRFNYVTGLFFYREDYDIDQRFIVGNDFCSVLYRNFLWDRLFRGAVGGGADPQVAFGNALATANVAASQCAAGPREAIVSSFSQRVESWAAYFQGTYEFTEQFSGVLGLRYTRDEKTGSFESLIQNQAVGPPSSSNPFGLRLRVPESAPDLSFNDSQFTWLATLRYMPWDGLMAYATVSTGYKAGGFDSESDSVVLGDRRVFDSETVTNLELGIKTRLGAIGTLNAALFRTNIENFQDRIFDGLSFVTLNAAELRQQGVEVDMMLNPIDRLSVMMGASYLDSEFLDYPDGANLPGFDSTLPRDLTGSPNNFSPKWTFSSSVGWRDRLSQNLDWFVRGDYQYIGSHRPSGTTDNNPATMIDAYSFINARMGFGASDGRWDVTLYGRNLTDSQFCQALTYQPLAGTLGLVDRETGNAMTRCILSTPRRFGVQFRYLFF